MKGPRSISVFDVIGPIMVGPSSSHTAGAVRLGLVGRALLAETPQFARIELHGSFADTGKVHGTDRALVAGLLGMAPSDERINTSFDQAILDGMQFEIHPVDLGEDEHPNSARLTLRGKKEEITMTGASVGGGLIEVTSVQDYPVRFTGELDTLIIIAGDQPGTVNTVTGWLRAKSINVAYLRVERDQRGGSAMMVIETDQTIPESLVRIIHSLPWMHWVRKINRLEE